MTAFNLASFNRSFVLTLLLAGASLSFTSASFAEESKGKATEAVAAKTLEGLLQQVQQFQQQENSLNKQRENIFKQNKQDQQALWKGIEDGTVDCIATDHAPHQKEEKLNCP